MSVEKHNSYYLAHVIYRNIPTKLIEAEGSSDAIYKKTVSSWLLDIGEAASEALVYSIYNN